ncbi:Ecto-NOX disulfide-thiol exchanger 2 [Homalodisca vitripennis]|nr:Ecto-NOX disulfide-thiol exchanger 2 [Homalodisca vitripennis]
MPPPTPAPMWGGMMGPMGYPVMGMNPMMGAQMMDPNMMMGQYNMMGMAIGPEGPMMGPDGTIIPPDPSMVSKEIIHFKTFTLFPPSPNAPPPTTRERPPGCKTIFVGGLPENATEEMIRELFGRCGEMLTVRLNNKKFCHIRFLHEASVDQALYFSGYRMRIGSNTDIPNTGRLHVDYAQARDDQYEWECRQRQLQREQRHRDRMEKERLRVPSPPPVVHYSDHEANIIADKIKSMFADEQFTKAVQVVITWLERGDCNKRNSNTFYSMIQSTNSHVRRLLTEKATYEEELTRAKELMKGRMQGLLIQCKYTAFCLCIIEDRTHLQCLVVTTTARRTRIGVSMPLRVARRAEGQDVVMNLRLTYRVVIDVVMNLRLTYRVVIVTSQAERTGHERCHAHSKYTVELTCVLIPCSVSKVSQIERVFSAASHKKVWDHFTKPQRKNIEMWKKQATEIKTVELEENLLAGGDEEMEVSDTDEDYPTLRKKPRKDDPSAALKEENDSLRCQLEAYKNEVDLVKVDLKVELEQKDKQLKMCQQTLQGMQQQLLDAKRKQGEEELKVLELQTRLKAKQTKEKETKEGEEGKEKEEPDGEVDTTDSLLLLSSKLSEKEAKLIGLISIFLHVHPFGAGVDYIWSYLQKLDPTLKTSEVETVMARFPSMFLQELSGIGANMERRWVYAGYKTTKLDS